MSLLQGTQQKLSVTQVTTVNDVDTKVTLSIDSSKCSHLFHFKLLRLTYLSSLSFFFLSYLDKRDGDSADDSILDYWSKIQGTLPEIYGSFREGKKMSRMYGHPGINHIVRNISPVNYSKFSDSHDVEILRHWNIYIRLWDNKRKIV